MPADIMDRWRDEDGVPSPAEENTDWWAAHPCPSPVWVEITMEYRDELYATIASLRAEVADLNARLARKAADDDGLTEIALTRD